MGGVVHHYGEFADPSTTLEIGTEVAQAVDEEPRRLYARIHSTGHLLDLAVTAAGYGHLKPTKGYHFTDGSYVEYEGNIDAKERAAAKDKIQTELTRLIKENLPVHITYGDSGVRHIAFGDDQGGPCGGTHVQASGELGEVTITKLKKKQKN